MRVSLSDEAQADANAAIDWYISEGAFIAADDFADALDQALGLLSRFPGLGGTGSRNTRTFPLHSFPYSLIYRLQVVVIRVISGQIGILNRHCPPELPLGIWGGR